jgi:hypothetical protein
MSRLQTAPTPAIVLMNGEVVVAKEEVKPMPGARASKGAETGGTEKSEGRADNGKR